MNRQCSKISKCNLFRGKLTLQEDSIIRYKCYFCLGDESRWSKCRRYQVMNELGFCPDFVMPNSLLSSEQILRRMRQPISVSQGY